jgi:hypothetical protein
MAMTFACVLNGTLWMIYAILVRDIFVLVPNLAALLSAAIQLNLYQWTTGKLEDTNWFIRLLQKNFNVKGVKTLKVSTDEENEKILNNHTDEVSSSPETI